MNLKAPVHNYCYLVALWNIKRDENMDLLQKRENTSIFHHFDKLPNTIIPISNPGSDRIRCHSW